MPVKVTKNNKTYSLVPAPLVSLSKQTFNNVGRPGFGAEYTINLQGTIIPYLGNPVYGSTGTGLLNSNPSGYFTQSNYWNDISVSPEELNQPSLSGSQYLGSIISKQELIRWLFTNPIASGGRAKPIKVSIDDWAGASGIAFNGYVEDISFDSDGRWANPASYNVTMKTSSFLYSANQNEYAFASGYHEGFAATGSGNKWSISNLTESYDIQEDDRRTITWNTTGAGISGKKSISSSDRVYSVSRSTTAVGLPVYGDDGEYISGNSPWKHAQNFVHEYLGIGSGSTSLREAFATGVQNQALKGLFGISGGTSGYAIADFKYQESIDAEAGTYSLNESFMLYKASGGYPVIESITVSHSTEENETNRLSVEGTIQGLNTTSGISSSGNEYNNALSYWSGYVNSGDALHAFHIARGGSHSGWLHPRPLSRSITSDYSAGTISYSYEFDDRPPNMVSGSISESIQINDTYPGELFSVTPVIGRSQPVLQYLNSRSEFKRSLSINVVMGSNSGVDFTKVNNSGLMSNHNDKRSYLQSLLLQGKPSITNKEDFATIFWVANPINDPTFTVVNGKCYHSAPTESWDPRTRNYSYNIEWTYERQNQI